MKRNPKIIAGAAALVLLLGGLVYITARIVPMTGEVRREMSLTPTPMPPVPDYLRADPWPVVAENPNVQDIEVQDMQRRLVELGYFTGSVDGYFGPVTREALEAFQKANALPVNGVLDRETRRVLYSNLAVPRQK